MYSHNLKSLIAQMESRKIKPALSDNEPALEEQIFNKGPSSDQNV